jgi:hypothetical protein
MAAAGGARRAHLRRAETQARLLAREKPCVAGAGAAQVRGTLALLGGDAARARSELAQAHDLYARTGMCLHAEAVRFRLGQLLSGSEGAALVGGAKAAAHALGVRNPERWFQALAPGFPE